MRRSCCERARRPVELVVDGRAVVGIAAGTWVAGVVDDAAVADSGRASGAAKVVAPSSLGPGSVLGAEVSGAFRGT